VAVPADTPVTTPELLTVAVGLLLLHPPPDVASLRARVPPTHTWLPPLIAAGLTWTVTGVLIVQPLPSE